MMLNAEYEMSDTQMLIFNKLKEKQMTRADLVAGIDKPRTTIYDNLMALMANNFVQKFSKPSGRRGRPLVFFRLIGDSFK